MIRLGFVTATDDPEGLGRVKVEYLGHEAGAESDWALIVTALAGDQTGFFTMPEVGDMVAIGFVNDDLNSPLMLGALWGWIYEQISPTIQVALTRAKHRHRAMARFARVKYGIEFSKIEAIRRTFSRSARIGIVPGSSVMDAILISLHQKKLRRRLEKFDLVTEEKRRGWEQERRDARESGAILLAYWSQTVKLQIQLATSAIIGSVTHTLFNGALARLLFGLGFLMWNVSKGLTLWSIH